jgi:hypothetical protein
MMSGGRIGVAETVEMERIITAKVNEYPLPIRREPINPRGKNMKITP